MSIINLIQESRNVLKDVMDQRGYDPKTIKDYTIIQLDELYDKASSEGNVNDIFSFSVNHKEIPEIKTHIIYYNLPKKGDTKSLRVTRSIINYIETIYEEEDINYEDNILLIINEKVSESIEHLLSKYNLTSKEKLINDEIDELNENIQVYINKDDNKYNIKNIHNVHICWLKIVAIDPLNHIMVPKHRIIKDDDEINKILIKCNCTKSQLPVVYSFSDTIVLLLGGIPGDLCEVIRINKHSGVAVNYRLCK